MLNRIGLTVFSTLFVLSSSTYALADDEAQSNAGEQLEQVEQTSQEAVVAPSDEQAKDLSGQGFDTPSQ